MKLSYLYTLLRKYDIVFVQETHGDDESVGLCSHRFAHSHHYHFSPGPDPATGGCLTFVSNRYCSCTCKPPIFEEFVPGRFVRLLLQFSIGNNASENLASLRLFNIHDEHLPSNSAMSALQVFENDLNLSQNFPLQHVIIFAGDLNRPESVLSRSIETGPL